MGLNAIQERIVEVPLIKKFGIAGCIQKANHLAERRYLFRCRHENYEWEHLREHGARKAFEKYNAADSMGRSELCLGDSDYADESIVCAALIAYAKKLEAHADGSAGASEGAPSDDAAIEHFKFLLCEYGMADDAILTKSARELKRKILDAVAPLLEKELRTK